MQASIFPGDEQEELVQHHLDLGQGSNLTELKIQIPSELEEDSWISLVPRLTQLTTTEFCTTLCYGFKALESVMPLFADGCPALETLIMTNELEVMDFRDLYPMDRHRNLKHIVISCSEIYGNASMVRRRFTSIKSLHLSAIRYNLEDVSTLEKASFEFVFTEKLSDDPYALNDLKARLAS